MKESNKQRSARQAAAPTQTLEIDVKGLYAAEAERGDFKRRKMTVFTGYAIFLVALLILLV